MHTALQLDVAHFRVTRSDLPSCREDILPNWRPTDRLGIVVTEPFGAVGASHLIQLSITSFYDIRPDRRAGKARSENPKALYPEIYLFHVGVLHGDHSAYDFWPARKEVLVERDPRAVLDAINDRAISRLLVPDTDPVVVEHQWKEPAAARDRIITALAYSPSGRVRSPEWQIYGLRGTTESNVERVLDPSKRYASKAATSSPPDSFDEDPLRSWPVRARARIDEASHGLELAQGRRQSIRDEKGLATESYRSVTVDDALHMLIGVPASQN